MIKLETIFIKYLLNVIQNQMFIIVKKLMKQKKEKLIALDILYSKLLKIVDYKEIIIINMEIQINSYYY